MSMATTITITIPPNTNTILPPSEVLGKTISDGVSISISNQSGGSIFLNSLGTSVSFSIDDVPSTIASSTNDSVELDILNNGDILFEYNEDSEIINVVLTEGAGCVVPTSVVEYGESGISCVYSCDTALPVKFRTGWRFIPGGHGGGWVPAVAVCNNLEKISSLLN